MGKYPGPTERQWRGGRRLRSRSDRGERDGAGGRPLQPCVRHRRCFTTHIGPTGRRHLPGQAGPAELSGQTRPFRGWTFDNSGKLLKVMDPRDAGLPRSSSTPAPEGSEPVRSSQCGALAAAAPCRSGSSGYQSVWGLGALTTDVTVFGVPYFLAGIGVAAPWRWLLPVAEEKIKTGYAALATFCCAVATLFPWPDGPLRSAERTRAATASPAPSRHAEPTGATRKE